MTDKRQATGGRVPGPLEASAGLLACCALLAASLYLASAPADLFPALAPVVAHTATDANVAMIPEAVTVLGARLGVLALGLATPVTFVVWLASMSRWRRARVDTRTGKGGHGGTAA